MQRRVSIVLALVLVGAALATGTAGMALAQEEPTATPTDNESEATTPIEQHEDPRNASEEGDLGQLSDWLSGHLSDRLEGGMVQLSQGQYDSVEGLVGDDFESRLSQFVDVAGETNAESDEGAAESMEETAETQQEFANDVDRYRETLAEYRDARDRGDEDAARERARELDDVAAEIARDGADVRDGYQSIGNATGRNLTAGTNAVDDVLTNVSTTRREVTEQTFVGTDLAVTANRSVAAFDRPATVEGRLVAENGTALSNRSITVQVGDRESESATDEAGRFSIVYRPVTVQADVDSVPVSYRPRVETAYLDSRANVSLGIDAVEPTITDASVPDAVGFDDRLAVNATIGVDGRPVPGLPGGAAVDGRTLAEANTSGDGEIGLAPSLPADVPAGERTVTVRAGADDRAISSGSSTASVTVTETATNLTIGTGAAEGDLVVSGALETTDGVPAPERSIVVDAGSTSETVTTNASGAYVAIPDGESLGATGEELSVTATFSGSGTNLGDATASTTAVVPGSSGDGGSDAPTGGDVPWVLLVAGVGALALLAGVIVLSLRWNRSSDGASPEPDPSGGEGRPATSGSDAERWFDAAGEALERGDDRGAVSRAYAASYARLRERLDFGEDRTPRELYAAAEGRVDEPVLDALATVTDAYERMAFASSGPTDARSVLEQARLVVQDRRSSQPADD